MVKPKTRKYEFHVTQDDIDAGVRADSSHCVIADTIARTLGVGRVAVDLQTITFTDPQRKERLTYLTPPIAQDHLVAFDQGFPVHPFEIVLRKPIQIRATMGKTGEPATIRRARARNERLTSLQAKRDHGAKLTRQEKGALTRMEQTGPVAIPARRVAPDPDIESLPFRVDRDERGSGIDVSRASPARTRVLADESGTQIHGGTPPKAATLSNRKGRVRRYGMRQLKPPAGSEPF